jgi:cysteine-rich repeat protein
LGLLYRDRSTGVLSLFVVHGIDLDTTGEYQPQAEVDFDLSGFPPGTTRLISDDTPQNNPPEFIKTSPTTYHGDWWFLENTDGGVVSDIAFPGNWTVTIHPMWNYGLSTWVWVDHLDQFHALDRNKDLYITADSVPVTCREDCTEPRCGDGILDPGEMCDDGNTTGGDGCAADCQSMP